MCIRIHVHVRILPHTQAALTARERQHQDQLQEGTRLHREQLAAYQRIESQGGTLHSLAAEAENLPALHVACALAPSWPT